MKDFDLLFATKVLQTAGRAITQSRYNTWRSVKDQKEYLLKICNDSMVISNFKYIKEVRNKLQFNHYILLLLLKKKRLLSIVLLLNLKNVFLLKK